MVPYINELLKFGLLVKQEDKTYKVRDRVVLGYLKMESEELSIQDFIYMIPYTV